VDGGHDVDADGRADFLISVNRATNGNGEVKVFASGL